MYTNKKLDELSKKNWQEMNCSEALILRAYLDGIQYNNDELHLYDVGFSSDAEELVAAFEWNDIDRILVTDQSTAVLNFIIELTWRGWQIVGVKTVVRNRRYVHGVVFERRG